MRIERGEGDVLYIMWLCAHQVVWNVAGDRRNDVHVNVQRSDAVEDDLEVIFTPTLDTRLILPHSTSVLLLIALAVSLTYLRKSGITSVCRRVSVRREV